MCGFSSIHLQKIFFLRSIATSNHLPDYWLKFDTEEDQMTAYLRSNKGGFRMLKDAMGVK